MTERRVQFKWGMFELKKGDATVQIDIAPSDPKGELVQGHTRGSSCFCKPAPGVTESNIPIFAHNRDRASIREREGY